jgi:hypothetical protein
MVDNSEKCKQPLFRRFFQWATTTILGIIASVIGILLIASTIFANFTGMLDGAESWCKVSCIFPWCECDPAPPPSEPFPPPFSHEEPIEQARQLFGNNATNLQVEIEPTPPLNIDQEIFLHFTNNSDSNGYFLAFSIDSEGVLFPFIPKTLKLPEIQRYLQIDKGQTLIIPQPNVPEDPFAGVSVDKTVGQAFLVVILVDELTLELVNVLLPEPEISTSKVLTNLHEKLIKQVPDGVGGIRRLQWYSLVIEYEIVSSTTKED